MTSTVPTTLRGLLVLVTCINSVSDGRASSRGLRDNCFGEPESLYGVLASVEKLLAEQNREVMNVDPNTTPRRAASISVS